MKINLLPMLLLAVLCGCAGLEPVVNEISVGVLLPLSGVHEKPGKEILAGIELAVSEINRDGGIDKRRIRLLIADDAGSPDKARDLMDRLIETDKVNAVMGGYATSSALVMREIAEKNEIPCVVISASSSEITEGAKFVSRVGFSDATQARALARFARERGYTRMAVLIDLDRDATYSRDLGRRIAQEFYDQYGDRPQLCGFRKDERSRTTALKQAMSGNTEVIALPLYFEEAVKCVKELRSLGYGGLIVAGDGASGDYAGAGVPAGDLVYTAVFSPEGNYPPAQKFINHFQELFNRNPESCEVMGYDAARMLAGAFRGAADTGRAAKNLREMRSYGSVLSPVSRESNGELRRSVFIIGVRPFGSKMIKMYEASSLADPVQIK